MLEQKPEINSSRWNKKDTACLVWTLIGALVMGAAIDRKEFLPFLGSVFILTISYNYLLEKIDN